MIFYPCSAHSVILFFYVTFSHLIFCCFPVVYFLQNLIFPHLVLQTLLLPPDYFVFHAVILTLHICPLTGEESGDIKIEVRIENKYMAKVKNDSISSLQSSRNASSASLEDLEHQRELLLRQMEDTDDSQDTQPLDGSQGEGEESDITDVPSPSTPQRSSVQSSNSFISFSTPRSMSISREFGTPLGFDSDQPLPAPEKFSSNITEHIPYENLPNATGMFEKMQNVVKKVRDKYKTFFS